MQLTLTRWLDCNMGATSSTSVVRIGDWEHEFCWMDAEDFQESTRGWINFAPMARKSTCEIRSTYDAAFFWRPQADTCGRRQSFVDFKLGVAFKYKKFILWQDFEFDVNKQLSRPDRSPYIYKTFLYNMTICEWNITSIISEWSIDINPQSKTTPSSTSSMTPSSSPSPSSSKSSSSSPVASAAFVRRSVQR